MKENRFLLTGMTVLLTFALVFAGCDDASTSTCDCDIDSTSNNNSGTGSGTEADPYRLTNGTWANGSISGSAVWYSFSVTSGTTYYIWWNDSYEGNGTKTLDVEVSAYYSNGTNIFYYDSGWYSPRYFNASSSGTVKIKVEPYSSGSTGTFAVAYRTTNSRP